MRTFDFTPLLRSGVGFDRFDRMFETLSRQDENAVNYPPYNIAKHGDDDYQITMAVAGFGEGDIDITVEANSLEIKAKAQPEKEGVTFLHRGIAGRGFERRFQLADDIKVVGARMEHGLLHVELKREVPEHKKPRKIEVGQSAAPKQLDQAA